MIKRLILTALTIGVVAILALPGFASLVPMSWGFPTLVQNNTLTSFQSAFQDSSDVQSADISFPTSLSGITSTAFPTILQDANAQSTLSQISFQQETQYSQFAYPFLSIGFSPIPSMGLL